MVDSIVALAKSIAAAGKDSASAMTLYGTIVDGGVMLDGSSVATPCSNTMSYKLGDRVMVVIDDHRAVVTGNVTSPSTDDSDAESILVFDTEYYIEGDFAFFTAHVYRSGADVTSEFDDSYFNWYLKSEESSDNVNGGRHLSSGPSMSIAIGKGRIGYGATVMCVFEPIEQMLLMTSDGDGIQSVGGDDLSALTAFVNGGRVRVTELTNRLPEADGQTMWWNDVGTYRSSVQANLDMARAEVEEKSELTAAQTAALLTF